MLASDPCDGIEETVQVIPGTAAGRECTPKGRKGNSSLCSSVAASSGGVSVTRVGACSLFGLALEQCTTAVRVEIVWRPIMPVVSADETPQIPRVSLVPVLDTAHGRDNGDHDFDHALEPSTPYSNGDLNGHKMRDLSTEAQVAMGRSS